MTDQELLARLNVAPGDFVTLNAEEAALVREALQRPIPEFLDGEKAFHATIDRNQRMVAELLGFDKDAR